MTGDGKDRRPGRSPRQGTGRGPDRGPDRSPDRGMGRVDQVLDGLLDRLGIREDVARQAAVGRWAEVVGPGIAEVTRARAVAQGVLYVDVRSSAWLNELTFMRHDLLTRLNAGAGSARVERIVFTLAGEGAFDDPPGGSGQQP
jgi:predicted nucleic acid-binding Zn ribbon protein